MWERRNARVIASCALAWLGLAAPAFAAESTIPGTGAVAGTVTAARPFTAAQVYLRSADKPVTFMVYTSGGKYQAINVLPGEYELTVARRGFASDPQKITVKAGATATADVALRNADPTPRPRVTSTHPVLRCTRGATNDATDVEPH